MQKRSLLSPSFSLLLFLSPPSLSHTFKESVSAGKTAVGTRRETGGKTHTHTHITAFVFPENIAVCGKRIVAER